MLSEGEARINSIPGHGKGRCGRTNRAGNHLPIYRIECNVTQGLGGVTVDFMLPNQLDWPHDHALTSH